MWRNHCSGIVTGPPPEHRSTTVNSDGQQWSTAVNGGGERWSPAVNGGGQRRIQTKKFEKKLRLELKNVKNEILWWFYGGGDDDFVAAIEGGREERIL
ncbi:hypothetical protein Tco_0012551 [Tanacetum coccineum]